MPSDEINWVRLFLQEEEKRKREELEQIMAENNRKIEEAQKKLVREAKGEKAY